MVTKDCFTQMASLVYSCEYEPETYYGVPEWETGEGSGSRIAKDWGEARRNNSTGTWRLPQVEGGKVTRLVLISDTHDAHPAVPEGEILIHAGDFACGDDFASLRRDIAWLKSLPHRVKILVKGNHDLVLNCRKDAAELLHPIHLLENSSIEINGVTFYGVGWKSTASIPEGTDVVISHEPCYGILDAGIGSPALRRAVLSAHPRLFVAGHVHGARGHAVVNGIHFYNATLDAPTKNVVEAMSHTITLPAGEPWVHELEINIW
jgi:Icc-related predicted phosphoesterase